MRQIQRFAVVTVILIMALTTGANADVDGDGVSDSEDNRLEEPNAGQEDSDGARTQAKSLVVPQGPGTVFFTVEAAAIDGLAHAHRVSAHSGNRRLSRGGTIVAVEGGYSYGPLISAKAMAPDLLRVRLDEQSVGHFHTYPSQHGRIDRRNETHSRADRAVVDRDDSGHRPSFILTPSLRVVAYHGRNVSKSKSQFVASLTEPLETQLISGR